MFEAMGALIKALAMLAVGAAGVYALYRLASWSTRSGAGAQGGPLAAASAPPDELATGDHDDEANFVDSKPAAEASADTFWDGAHQAARDKAEWHARVER